MSNQLSNFVQRFKYQYNRNELLGIGKTARGLSLPQNFSLLQLGLLRYRGVRGGIYGFRPLNNVNNGVNFNNLHLLPQYIPTIIRPRNITLVENADISN